MMISKTDYSYVLDPWNFSVIDNTYEYWFGGVDINVKLMAKKEYDAEKYIKGYEIHQVDLTVDDCIVYVYSLKRKAEIKIIVPQNSYITNDEDILKDVIFKAIHEVLNFKKSKGKCNEKCNNA